MQAVAKEGTEVNLQWGWCVDVNQLALLHRQYYSAGAAGTYTGTAHPYCTIAAASSMTL